ncbi:MAG: hypothetical protein WA667_23840 [Candidatus Nitrosopolaris sp.]
MCKLDYRMLRLSRELSKTEVSSYLKQKIEEKHSSRGRNTKAGEILEQKNLAS